MNHLDIPFNIDILVLDDKQRSMLRPVKSLDTFVGATKNFNPDGLYSTEIFGVAGTKSRYENFSYIDLKVPILHPVIFKSLGQVKALYLDVIARRSFAVWDPELKDLVKSDQVDGRTGFEFFCEYLPRINYPTNDSESRQMAVELLTKYRGQEFIRSFLVIPAGYREFEIDDAGRETTNEINDFYYKLIAISNTINALTIRGNVASYDMQRVSMQNASMELYDLFSKIIEGKKNLLMGKFAGRRIFNGTRNVITSNVQTPTYLGHERNITINDTMVGLYQFAKATLPITLNRLSTGWLSKCFQGTGAPAVLCDPKTRTSDSYMLKHENYSRWLSLEGLEKSVSYFQEESIRHNAIMIEGKYLGLVYRGPDKTFAFLHGIEELPSGRNPEDCKPITWVDLLYYSIYKDSRKFSAFVTRYPVTGIGSIFPSRAYLKTTIESEERVELDTLTWERIPESVAYEFPVHGSSFFNSLSPHPWRLVRMGADFDGDTASFNAIYSDNACAECETFYKSKKAYMGTDGRFINDFSVDTVNYVLENITGG
jgi:hypothetical protein